jgi:ubiquinone/menaquinone biosynthesis C-methylase UbiE
VDEYTDVNRHNWNVWTGFHTASEFYDVAGFKAGKLSLNPLEREELGDVNGKTLLHLQCHFGLDTLSWARLGARVTGVDFAEDAISAAQTLARETVLDARFICSNIYRLPEALDEQFDIVFTSYGVLFWLQDLQRWAEIVARSLKPGGTFYIVEMHPFANVFNNDITELQAKYSYTHQQTPHVEEFTGTYAGASDYRATEYTWSFGLGETLTALLQAGLRLEWVHEFPFAYYQQHPALTQHDDGTRRWADPANTIPLLFSVRAAKE